MVTEKCHHPIHVVKAILRRTSFLNNYSNCWYTYDIYQSENLFSQIKL